MFSLVPHNVLARLPLPYYPYLSFMHKYKCIFVHVPKNAGSSVLKAFGYQGSRWHAKYYDFLRASPYFYDKYISFAIIRNPVSRLYSAYGYITQGGNGSEDDLALKSLIEEKSSCINSFVTNVLSYQFIVDHLVFTPQYLFVFDRLNQLKVDKLIAYESLEQEWQDFAQQHDLPKSLPKENVAKITKFVELSSDTLDKIYLFISTGL